MLLPPIKTIRERLRVMCEASIAQGYAAAAFTVQ
jgi:hypothetical protein